jgi:hypothetical protein
MSVRAKAKDATGGNLEEQRDRLIRIWGDLCVRVVQKTGADVGLGSMPVELDTQIRESIASLVDTMPVGLLQAAQRMADSEIRAMFDAKVEREFRAIFEPFLRGAPRGTLIQ